MYLLGLEIRLCRSVSVLFSIKIINLSPFIVRCIKQNCTSWEFFLGDFSEQFLFFGGGGGQHFSCTSPVSLEMFGRSRENGQTFLYLL